MSSIRVWVLFSLLWLLPFASVSAQDVQVPFDCDSTLYTIDAELRKELGLFPEIDGFQSAEISRVAEDTYELVFRYRRSGKTLRKRRSLSLKEVEALRQRGIFLARRNDWSGGHAEMLSYSGLSGTLIGSGVGAALIANAGSDVDDTESGEPRVVAGTSLLGSLVGEYLGHRMGRTGQYTQGDARIYLQSGFLAANLTSAILASADTWEDQTLAILLSGAGTGDLALGRRLVRDHTFTRQEGNLVFLGSSAGSLLGLGMAAALGMGEEGANVSQAVGSLAGFSITYSIFSQEARDRRTLGGMSSTTFDLLHLQ